MQVFTILGGKSPLGIATFQGHPRPPKGPSGSAPLYPLALLASRHFSGRCLVLQREGAPLCRIWFEATRADVEMSRLDVRMLSL